MAARITLKVYSVVDSFHCRPSHHESQWQLRFYISWLSCRGSAVTLALHSLKDYIQIRSKDSSVNKSTSTSVMPNRPWLSPPRSCQLAPSSATSSPSHLALLQPLLSPASPCHSRASAVLTWPNHSIPPHVAASAPTPCHSVSTPGSSAWPYL
jgi:hypothetical protein